MEEENLYDEFGNYIGPDLGDHVYNFNSTQKNNILNIIG